MANNPTLKTVADRLVSDIKVLSEEVRETKYNKEAHMLSISTSQILEEIESQIGTKAYTRNEEDIISTVSTFTKEVFDSANYERKAFLSRANNNSLAGFAVELVSLNKVSSTTNDKDFRILIISLSGRGSAFNKAKSIKLKAENEMIKGLKRITGKDFSFDIGHTEAVSAMQVQDAALSFVTNIKSNKLSIPYSVRKATSYKSIVKVAVQAKKTRKLQREYLIKISEAFPSLKEIVNNLKDKDPMLISAILEDAEANRARGRSQEKKEKNRYLKEAQELTKKINFARVRSSPSLFDDILNEILLEAVKAGATIKGKKPSKSTGSSSPPIEKKIKRNNTIQVNTKSTSYSSPNVADLKSPKQRTNWLQLLPIINSRLTDTVAKNMKSPRLNFRTGRFAQSARVVNVEQTPQGFPSFVFDYERDPYDVFDRTLGRSPWNTPQRDPRTLVDQSIREIVREMAIGRFFTRRA